MNAHPDTFKIVSPVIVEPIIYTVLAYFFANYMAPVANDSVGDSVELMPRSSTVVSKSTEAHPSRFIDLLPYVSRDDLCYASMWYTIGVIAISGPATMLVSCPAFLHSK